MTELHDRTLSFSAHHGAAGVMWVVGLTLVVAFLVTERAGLGALGISCQLIAGTVNIRGFFCEQHQREDVAYNLGREAGIRSVR